MTQLFSRDAQRSAIHFPVQSMTQFLLVTTTVAERAEAERIARALVERRLAACVQIAGPVSSTYWWQGKIETAEEWVCIAKTRDDKFAELEKAVREIHPYEVPEIIAMPVAEIGKAYRKWMDGELG
jgi:periplasmic divalent cation tolerance protein